VHATRHFLMTMPPSRGDEIRVPPVCPLERIDNPRMFAIEECTGILHNLLFLLGEGMPQDAQGPAMDCLEMLTSEVKAQQELLEVLESGERQVAESLQQVVEDMCIPQQAEEPTSPEEVQAEATPKASGPFEGDVLPYRAEGELLKLEIKEMSPGSSLGHGAFEWTRQITQEEYLVAGSYSSEGDSLQLTISTVHYRSPGKEDFQESEVLGSGIISATHSLIEGEDLLQIGPNEQWPDAQPIQLQRVFN